MAIRFITAWNGYRADQIVDGLGGAEEARLISLKFAVADLDGPDNTPTPVTATKTLTGGVKLMVADGKSINSVLGVAPTGLSVLDGTLYLDGRTCREIGVNACSLLKRTLDGTDVNRHVTDLPLIASYGIRVIRVAIGGLNSAEWLAYVHGGGQIKIPQSWSDLSPSFGAACDSLFTVAAENNIRILASLVWQWNTVQSLFGEDNTVGYSTSNSLTRQYLRAFWRLFAERYKDHAGLGGYVCGNEYPTKEPYVTAAATAEVWQEFAATIKAVDPLHIVIAAPLTHNPDYGKNRMLMKAETDALIGYTANHDTLDGHAYPVRSWMSEDPQTADVSTGPVGYEYAHDWLTYQAQEARRLGRAYICSECGTLEAQEVSPSIVKNTRFFNGLKSSGVQLALMWDWRSQVGIANSDIAPGTTRGTTALDLIQRYNSILRGDAQINPTRPSIFVPKHMGALRPKVCAKSDGIVGSRINLPLSTAAFGTATPSFMLWIRKDAAIGNSQPIAQLTNSSGLTGFRLMSDSSGAELIAQFRDAAGTIATSAGTWNADPNSEWNHFAVRLEGGYINCYKNGAWWKKIALTGTYAALTTGIATYLLGNTTSASALSVADFVFAEKITAEDVINHYAKGLSPKSTILRYKFDGDCNDSSGNGLHAAGVGGITFVDTGL